MTENCEKAILKRINASKRGSVFTPSYFSGLGSRDAIDMALSRLTKSGDIRRIARGVYDYPVVDPLLGESTPDYRRCYQSFDISRQNSFATIRRLCIESPGPLRPGPAKNVFLTEAESRKLKIGPMEIELRRTTLKNMASAGRQSDLVIQAFRTLGKEHITKNRIEQMKANIPLEERKLC